MTRNTASGAARRAPWGWRFLCAAILAASACGDPAETDAEWSWELPDGLPRPRVPADNPMSHAKVELGRRLFYDRRLSANGTQSCASCHQQARAFTEPRATSLGSTGEAHVRNAMSLANVAYATRLNWADPDTDRLEDQALTPLFGDDPIELGLDEATLLERLGGDPEYRARFEVAFADEAPAERLTVSTVTKALAAFQRALVSADSPLDRYRYGGDPTALSPDAVAGLALFTSERLGCSRCPGDFNFTTSSTHEGSTFEAFAFHNTGLYDVDGEGSYPERDRGLFDITAFYRDMGRFKAPTLRNIAVTAPYMHDGSIATLDAVLDHYAAGGRNLESGPDAGDGRANPFKSELITGFELTHEERGMPRGTPPR